MTVEILNQRDLPTPEYVGGPEVRALELIALDSAQYGEVQPETKARILDEELTWVAELVAQQTDYAVIPRKYQRHDGDFVDVHGVSISGVMDAGATSIAESVINNEVGAEKEQRRRNHELENFHKQIDLPNSSYMVEFSLTDDTWTEAERKQWGYSGDTLVRVTYVNTIGDVEQANICLPLSGAKFARALSKEFGLQGSVSSESILANPYIASYSGEFSEIVKRIERRVSAAEMSAHPVIKLLTSIKRIKQQKKDAWNLVSTDHELKEKLWSELEAIARDQPAYMWQSVINDVRRGYWKLSLESANGKKSQLVDSSIGGASVRSRADGDIFTACGGTSESGSEIVASDSLSYASRLVIVASLNEKKGAGSCDGCKDFTDLYGCGSGGTFCRSCNDTWCKEYLITGKMLEGKQLLEAKYRRYARFATAY